MTCATAGVTEKTVSPQDDEAQADFEERSSAAGADGFEKVAGHDMVDFEA